MDKDTHLKHQEDEYRRAVNRSICYEAAVLIQNGNPELDALETATAIHQLQEEAANDPTGAIGTLAEAQSPTPESDHERQRKAIAARLYDKHFRATPEGESE